MSIELNYNKTVLVKRLSPIDESEKESYEDHLIGIKCEIQPLEESYTEDLTGSFGKDWLMFCDAVDILEGDKIIDGDITYKVIGVESFEFLGEVRHMELRIRLFND